MRNIKSASVQSVAWGSWATWTLEKWSLDKVGNGHWAQPEFQGILHAHPIILIPFF